MPPIVEAQCLTKHFGDVAALDGLDLIAHSGQVLAVLGPNGSGKTTFVRSVATLLRPDSGTLTVAGRRRAIGPRRAGAVHSVRCPGPATAPRRPLG